jgi:hypothetical protein
MSTSDWLDRHGLAVAIGFGILLAIIAALAIMLGGSLNTHPVGTGAF